MTRDSALSWHKKTETETPFSAYLSTMTTMNLNKKSVEDLDVSGKRVLIRVSASPRSRSRDPIPCQLSQPPLHLLVRSSI